MGQRNCLFSDDGAYNLLIFFHKHLARFVTDSTCRMSGSNHRMSGIKPLMLRAFELGRASISFASRNVHPVTACPHVLTDSYISNTHFEHKRGPGQATHVEDSLLEP